MERREMVNFINNNKDKVLKTLNETYKTSYNLLEIWDTLPMISGVITLRLTNTHVYKEKHFKTKTVEMNQDTIKILLHTWTLDNRIAFETGDLPDNCLYHNFSLKV